MQEGGGESPHGSLGWAIDTHFGSFEALIKKVNAEGAALQGSGWVVSCADSEIFSMSTSLHIIRAQCLCFLFLFEARFCLYSICTSLPVAWSGQRVQQACC